MQGRQCDNHNKYYYQSLSCAMINSIRQRHLQKPVITHQIIYNHRQEHLDTNSQMSFLKLSENSSNQLNNPNLDSFAALESHLNLLTSRSQLKFTCLQSAIKCLETGKDYCLADSSINGPSYRDIIEQNKQNTRMTYPQLAAFGDDGQNMQEINFEIDENRNYIKNMGLNQRNKNGSSRSQNLSKREFYSLSNSPKLQPKQICPGQTVNPNSKRRLSIPINSNTIKNEGKAACWAKRNLNPKSDRQQSKPSAVSESDAKKGKIYEYILSRYSISKLLAMQQQNK